jgi:hypothetical protein
MLVYLLTRLQRESNGKRPLSNECTGDRTESRMRVGSDFGKQTEPYFSAFRVCASEYLKILMTGCPMPGLRRGLI